MPTTDSCLCCLIACRNPPDERTAGLMGDPEDKEDQPIRGWLPFSELHLGVPPPNGKGQDHMGSIAQAGHAVKPSRKTICRSAEGLDDYQDDDRDHQQCRHLVHRLVKARAVAIVVIGELPSPARKKAVDA